MSSSVQRMDGSGETNEWVMPPQPHPLRRFGGRLLASPAGIIGVALTLFLLILAVGAPVIATHDPLSLNPADRLQPPSLTHFFGTDDSGRDIFSRVVYGSRLSLLAGVVVLLVATTLGTTIGLISGYSRRSVDDLLMRMTDIFLSFPPLVLAMAVSAALGASLVNAMLAIGIVWWPWYARLVRGQVLRLKHETFVEAARASGASNRRILVNHILPNCLSPIIVQMSLDVGFAILTTASLSFIGLGAQPPSPEWGSMIAIGRTFILDQWWFPTFPGVAIFISVMAFNFLGEGLQEALSPRTLRR